MKHVFPFLYGVLLLAFTTYAALDTFVITRVYQTVSADAADTARTETTNETSTEESSEDSTSGATVSQARNGSESSSRKNSRHKSSSSSQVHSNTPSVGHSQAEETTESAAETTESAAAVSTQTTYQDANITVTLTEYNVDGTAVYVADVTLSSAEYLKTAFAQNAYGRNVTAKVSDMAESTGAILAINGDYYGARQSGYVIRDGVLYRDTAAKNQEDLVIYADGHFEIINESNVTAQELIEAGAQTVLSFGPGLVIDGQVSVTANEEVGKAMASNPRTAIGIIDDLHYVFVVSDGRTDESEGLTLQQLAAFMQSLGCTQAYNLDGGGSSTMVFQGSLINNPTTTGNNTKERSVSDIVYIGY